MKKRKAKGSWVLVLVLGLLAPSFPTAAREVSPVQACVTIGTFVFSPGQKLALEFSRTDPCPCWCGPLQVQQFSVFDSQGLVVYADDAYAYPVAADQWVGRWDLVDASGRPVQTGQYTAVVETSLGEFRVGIEVVAPTVLPLAGRVTAQATVCGLGLWVYRLMDETDHETRITLRVGERLMVALQGNPTTGYEWEIDHEPAIVKRLPGLEYLSPSGPIGAGGVFYFRYQAMAVGEDRFTFVYRRPWEAGPPEKKFVVYITVQ